NDRWTRGHDANQLVRLARGPALVSRSQNLDHRLAAARGSAPGRRSPAGAGGYASGRIYVPGSRPQRGRAEGLGRGRGKLDDRPRQTAPFRPAGTGEGAIHRGNGAEAGGLREVSSAEASVSLALVCPRPCAGQPKPVAASGGTLRPDPSIGGQIRQIVG